MINIKDVKRYCKEYKDIENYEKAISDESQMWCCHHRLETETSDGEKRPRKAQLKKAELIALGMYWNRPAEELVFLTRKEHKKIHRTIECTDDFGSAKEDRKSYEKVHQKAYYQEHREERLAYKKAYDKAYNKAHKEEQKAYVKAYYQGHKEERLAYVKAYRAEHKEEKNRADKVRNFIKAHGSVPVEELPKTWNEEDIKYYLNKIGG